MAKYALFSLDAKALFNLLSGDASIEGVSITVGSVTVPLSACEYIIPFISLEERLPSISYIVGHQGFPETTTGNAYPRGLVVVTTRPKGT